MVHYIRYWDRYSTLTFIKFSYCVNSAQQEFSIISAQWPQMEMTSVCFKLSSWLWIYEFPIRFSGTHISSWAVHNPANIGYCSVLSCSAETGWLWWYHHCWINWIHHRALAAYSFQYALIGLSSFLSNSDDNKGPRKSVRVHLWELQKKTRVSRWWPRDEVNTSPSFSASVREPQTDTDNWAHTLCAGPQLQSCSRTIMHHHNSTNMPKLILQRWMERSQKQPSCEKPPLSSSPDSIQALTVAIGILINRLISLQLMLSACKQL